MKRASDSVGGERSGGAPGPGLGPDQRLPVVENPPTPVAAIDVALAHDRFRPAALLADSTSRPLRHAALLQLQHDHGNAHVQRVLADRWEMLGRLIQRDPPTIPPAHDESTKGSQASKLDWDATPGTYGISTGEITGSLRETYQRKLAEQIKVTFGDWATPGAVQDLIRVKADRVKADRVKAGELDGGMDGESDTAVELREIRTKLWQANQYAVVETLNVDASTRYKPKPGTTYCNVYGYDMVTALGGYLPRVWWTKQALDDIKGKKKTPVDWATYQAMKKNNEPTDKVIAPIWAETVHEQSANQIADWLRDWGRDFGWAQTGDVDEAQKAANSGQVVIAVAFNEGVGATGGAAGSGHVSVVLAEQQLPANPDAGHKAPRDAGGRRAAPLQSQAGGTNFKYGDQSETGVARAKWWKQPGMRKERWYNPKTKQMEDGGNFWISKGLPQTTSIASPEKLGAKSPG